MKQGRLGLREGAQARLSGELSGGEGLEGMRRSHTGSKLQSLQLTAERSVPLPDMNIWRSARSATRDFSRGYMHTHRMRVQKSKANSRYALSCLRLLGCCPTLEFGSSCTPRTLSCFSPAICTRFSYARVYHLINPSHPSTQDCQSTFVIR